MRAELEALADGVAEGDKASVARALNLIEDRREEAERSVGQLLGLLAERPRSDAGHRVGFTGPPGVGKSSLLAVVARELRARDQTVGIVAVDPSSTRSGGALLGDRTRMGFDPADTGLFVRSLATAGDVGGLSYSAHAAVAVLAAAYERVLIETTGVGQSETDVEHVADTVCLVVQPGSGDTLQFIKAGIMEIPDILVVNKADQGTLAERAAADLQQALDTMSTTVVRGGWRVPVLLTSAQQRKGVGALCDAMAHHRAGYDPEGLARRRLEGDVRWIASMLQRRHGEHAVQYFGGPKALRRRIREALTREPSPVALGRQLGEQYLQQLRAGAS